MFAISFGSRLAPVDLTMSWTIARLAVSDIYDVPCGRSFSEIPMDYLRLSPFVVRALTLPPYPRSSAISVVSLFVFSRFRAGFGGSPSSTIGLALRRVD